jgi:hypothetical protein
VVVKKYCSALSHFLVDKSSLLANLVALFDVRKVAVQQPTTWTALVYFRIKNQLKGQIDCKIFQGHEIWSK